MASPFDRLRLALKRQSAPAADWSGAVAAAVDVLNTAERRLEELQSRRGDMLTADDVSRSGHRLALREAEYDIEDARGYLAALQQRQATAALAEAEAARQVRYAAAVAKRDAAAKALAAEYPKLAAGLVKLLRLVAETEAQVQSANSDLPEGATPIAGPEAQVRDWPALRREELAPTERAVWVFASDGRQVPEGRWDEITAVGELYLFPGPSGPREVVKATERETRWLPDEGAFYGARLAELRLPGLRYGDPAFHDGTSGYPAMVMARSDALAAGRPSSRPKRQPESRQQRAIVEDRARDAA